MTVTDTSRSCIQPQTLARLAEGTLPREDLPGVLAHLVDCADCTEAVELANDVLGEEVRRIDTPPVRGRWWLTLAAAAMVALFALLAVWAPFSPFRERDGIRHLVELTPRTERLVEPRLTGGFGWAEYRGPVRDIDPAADALRMKLFGAAGEAMERAQRDDSATTQHTAGVAMLLVDRPEDAVKSLQAVVARAPQDASAWSDLAAAQYAAAVRHRRSSLYPQALASADRALRIDARHAEALFNRALILQKIGLREEARSAWQRYLAVDPSSAWAAEAQRYLKEIPAVDQDAQFRRELPQFEQAAASGNAARVRELVAAYPQQARTWGEGIHLGAWAEAEQKGNAAEAAKMLAVARATGEALRARGETLLADAVAAIDASRGGQRATLAAAHVTYKRGRMMYSQRKPTEGEVVLRDAARQFAAAGSPMALVARYFAANAAYDRQQTTQACRELQPLLAEGEGHGSYPALVGQIQWQLALCAGVEQAWKRALTLERQAEAIFTRQREWRNAATMAGMMATSLSMMGRLDEAWDARIRAFEALSAAGNRERLRAAVLSASWQELRLRRLDTGRAVLQLEESMTRADGDVVFLSNVLVRSALISSSLGDATAATRLAAEAAAAAMRIDDAGLRAQALAHVHLANGAVVLETSPLQARESLSRAVDAYLANENSLSLPEAYLLRARAAMRLRDARSAIEDVDRGIEILERHAIHFAGSVVGTGVLDAGAVLYEEAIRLQLAAGQAEAAFRYAERARAQLATRAAPLATADELRERLAGSGTAILELVALPDEVIAFCVTGKELTTSRTRIDRARLEELVVRDDVRALYDLLIRPSLLTVDDARTLMVVAGAPLRNVPFGALVDRDTNQVLIERLAVVLAPSAALLRREAPSSQPQALLAVVLPSGDGTAPLPDADLEIAELHGLYGRATVLAARNATFRAFASAAPHATVLHISGHTDREPTGEERAFVFSGGERVSWQMVAGTTLERDAVVVLSACDTLRAPLARDERSLSLGDAFLSAGARAVLGTLKPIPDRDARLLFAAFHRELASGVREDEALRRVQRDALARAAGDSWRSVVLLTNRIHPQG